jgi:hypothetical protein
MAGGGIVTLMETMDKFKDWLIYAGLALLLFGVVVWVVNLKLTVLEQPFLGGAFNTSLLGVPAYLFVGLGLVILILALEFGMSWFYWRPFEYMHGLYRAYWDKINAVFVGDLKNRYQLIAENKAKLVHLHEDYEKLYDDFFRDKDLMTRASVWIGRRFGRNYDMMIAKSLEPGMPDKSIVHAGGIDVDLVFDFDNWIYTNSPQRQEMIKVTDMWNVQHPEDEIYTIQKFQNYFIDKKFDGMYNPDILKKTVTIPWARIKAAFPTKGATTPGYERQRAKEIEDEQGGDLKGYMWPMIGLTILMILLLMGMRAVHLVGHAPAVVGV